MSTEQNEGSVTIQAPSDLYSDTVLFDFTDRIKSMIEDGETEIVLDLKNVNALNSAAIGKILYLHKLIRSRNGNITFTNLNEKINDLFNRLMFSKLFNYYPEVSE